jgi:hypothetical protein
MSDHASLDLLAQSLDGLRQQRLSIADFCAAWRAESGLLQRLPARYGTVMEDLLQRLESGSLFTEESCSFSQQDLQDSLSVWLQKARQTLSAAPA